MILNKLAAASKKLVPVVYGPYWLISHTPMGNGVPATVTAIDVDYEDNIIIVGRSSNYATGYSYGLILKYNKYGNLLWQTLMDDPGGTQSDEISDVKVDSLGNIYVVGSSFRSGGTGGSSDVSVAKFDKYGANVWKSIWYYPSTYNGASEYGYTVALNPNEDKVYVGSYVNWNPTSAAIIAGQLQVLSASTGSQLAQFANANGSTGYTTNVTDIVVDSSDNIYTVGIDNYTATNATYLNIWNSSNQPVVAKKLSNSQRSGWPAIQKYNQNYLLGSTEIYSGVTSMAITMIDSSYQNVWAKVYSYGSTSTYIYDIAIDSIGNIYAIGQALIGGYNSGIVFKVDSTGTLLWARSVTSSYNNTSSLYGRYCIHLDSNDNLICGFPFWNSNISTTQPYILKIPNSGDATGTYGEISYQPITLTSSSSTITIANGGPGQYTSRSDLYSTGGANSYQTRGFYVIS